MAETPGGAVIQPGTRLSRAQRRAQLLAVGRRLFAAQGYHHVAMDDIAEQACVTKPVLYRHFPSKLHLYLAIVDAAGEELLVAIDRALRPVVAGTADSGQDVVAAIVSAYITFVDAAGESSALLFESDVMHDPDVRDRVDHASSEAMRRVAEVLAQVAGLSTVDSEATATALVSAAAGAAVFRMRRGEPTCERTTALVSDLAWRGIAGLVEHHTRSSDDLGSSHRFT